MRLPISVAALPMSIWPQAMSNGAAVQRGRFGEAGDGVLGGGVGAERGRGACAEIEPLLMMRPPCGACVFISAERRLGAEEGAVQVGIDDAAPVASSSSSIEHVDGA
jgi:hypothetical protein